MCGIVGYIGPKRVVPVILDGLKRLEYRGYDSAGIAVVQPDGKLEIRRAPANCKTSKNPSASLRSMESTASATRAGPLTAVPPKKTRILIATAPAKS